MNLNSRITYTTDRNDPDAADQSGVVTSVTIAPADSLTMPLLDLIETAEAVDEDIEILVDRGDRQRAHVALQIVCDLVLAIAATEPVSIDEAKRKVLYICAHRKGYGPGICKETAMLDAVLDHDCETWGIWIADRDCYDNDDMTTH